MKIYRYIALFAVTLFFTSCERDDDTEVAAQSSNIQVVVEPFGTASGSTMVGQIGTNSSVIDFGFRLTEYTTNYFGSDVVITFEGNNYTIPAGDTEVVVGPTMVDFDIAAPIGAIPYNGMIATSQIDLSETSFDINVLNRPSDLVVLKGEGGIVNVSTTIYGQLPVVTPGQINFLFDWSPNDDAGNDIDLRIRNSSGLSIDYSGSVNNYESVVLEDSEADGMYEVRADSWSTIGGTINGIVFAMHSDGTLEVFETDLSALPSFNGNQASEIVMVKIAKVGGVYTLSQ